MEEVKQDSQIYVACLASYNAGRLFGKWITPADTEEKLLAQQEQLAQLNGKSNEAKTVFTTATNNLTAAEKVATDSKQKYDAASNDLAKSKQVLTTSSSALKRAGSTLMSQFQPLT